MNRYPSRTRVARRALPQLSPMHAAALLALAALLLLCARPAAAEDRALPGEGPAPAAGLVWAGVGSGGGAPEAGPRSGGDDWSLPKDRRLSLTIPRLDLEDVRMPNSSQQADLDTHGIMRLAGTGFPWERLSNTYIAGHAQGYAGSRVPHVFRDLEDLRDGDRIVVRDARGRDYTYKVYKSLVVSPYDVWVTQPIPNRKVLTLQTCWPAPSFGQRLIVRAEFVGAEEVGK